MDQIGETRIEASLRRGALDGWLEDHEALTETIRAGGDFESDLPLLSGFAMLRAERLAGAVLDRQGRILLADESFHRLFGSSPPALEAFHQATTSRRSQIAWVGDGDDHQAVVAYGAIERARDWTLPPEIRGGLDDRHAAFVALAVSTTAAGTALDGACRAYGLTELQTRVVRGLVRFGDVPRAAAGASVAYDTARKVVAEAMRRTGARRLPDLVRRIVRLSLGVWPSGRDGAAALRDVWGLTERQAGLAMRIAEGLTRNEAARAAGLSEAVAKKQLDQVFAVLGVRTAGQLSRVLTETMALTLLTEATHHDVYAHQGAAEPLGLFRQPDGRQVAYSDHGPRSGRPVLVVHSSSSSRPAPSLLVSALQASGYRPITLDRPGFGLTDVAIDRAAHRLDPFGGSVPDVSALLDRLRLDRIDVIGKGGAQAVLALARAMPDRIGRVVLVNPDPPTSAERRRGPLQAIKEAFVRRPDLIERMTGLIVTGLSEGAIERVMRGGVHSSPADVELMADPRNLVDYARGYRMFLTGRVAGYVDEQVAMTRWTTGPLTVGEDWTVLLGEFDPLHDPEVVRAFWRGVLPGARFETVPSAGRFLAMSHPERVVAALQP